MGVTTLTHPLSTPRMRFMTKNAPSTTIETKKVTATYAFPMASKTCMHSHESEREEKG